MKEKSVQGVIYFNKLQSLQHLLSSEDTYLFMYQREVKQEIKLDMQQKEARIRLSLRLRQLIWWVLISLWLTLERKTQEYFLPAKRILCSHVEVSNV